MSEVRYFQRYSQRENVITNNTLSFLYKFYLHSRERFQQVIESFVADKDVTFNVGPRFQQQISSGNGVIDGLLFQDSFNIAIETKVDSKFRADQLIRHLDGLDGKDNALLLAISKGHPSTKVITAVEGHKSKTKTATFVTTTFEKLIVAVEDLLTPYDQEMRAISDDFRAFCEENDLIDFRERTMLGVPTNASLPQNQDYHIYYEPARRNHSKGFAYLGLYNEKAIRFVGRIQKTVLANWNGETVSFPPEQRVTLQDEELARLISMFQDTDYFTINQGHRFYFVDEFNSTTYTKSSPYPLQGKKYFALDELHPRNFKAGMSGPQLAELLDGQDWL